MSVVDLALGADLRVGDSDYGYLSTWRWYCLCGVVCVGLV